MRVRVKNKAITSTALISMTDFVFLLLIFILISSSFVTITGQNIELPTAHHMHSEIHRNLSLSMNAFGEIFINHRRVEREDLIERLREHIEETPEIVVVIQADQSLAYRYVIDLIDAARAAGSTRFYLATQLRRL
jgi:biopolymer transport protein ExbD